MIKSARLTTLLALISLTVIPFPPGPALAQGGEAADRDHVYIGYRGILIRTQDGAAILAAPSEELRLRFVSGLTSVQLEVKEVEGIESWKADQDVLQIKTPFESGNRPVKVLLASTREGEPAGPETVNFWLMAGYPSSLIVNGCLNGFELGEYPDWQNMSNPDKYKPPAYFYLLDHAQLGRFISENIRLGDLGYDGRAPIPQYFALDYELVNKMEELIFELRRRGLPSRIHFIGGGFISPKSNIARTSRTAAAASLSRHMWGEAVDFMVDENPRDGIMDDMDGNGVIDVRDALLIKDIIIELEETGRVELGGIGIYSPPRNSQIQLHVDVRGYQTSWGYEEYDPKIFAGVPPKRSLRPGE